LTRGLEYHRKKAAGFDESCGFAGSATKGSNPEPQSFEWFSPSKDTHGDHVTRSGPGETTAPLDPSLGVGFHAIHRD
jgi:hypothetical protein